MYNPKKYQIPYFMPKNPRYDWVTKDHITEAPVWCSVDLRDGNQALIEPMSLDEKLEFFRMLVEIGFKEIEIGFPAASDTEYKFARTLIENNMVPSDVTLQVLTQAREHIIKKTFEAVKGAPKAIIHLYNSTSVAQREQVLKKDKKEIKKIAEVLNTSVEYLMGLTDDAPLETPQISLPINNTQPENKISNDDLDLGFWGGVVERAERAARSGDKGKKALIAGMLRMATDAIAGAEAKSPGENFIGVQENHQHVGDNYVKGDKL